MRGLNNIPGLLNRNNKTEKVGNFVINDIELHVPPTAISVHKEGLHYSMKALRTKSTTKILSGSGVYHAQVKITFPQDSLISLHRLICEIKNSPFVSIENKFISDSIGHGLPGTPGNASSITHSFTVMGLQVTNHPSSPNAFLCELDLRLFNYKPYTRYFGYKKEFLHKSNGKYYAHRVFDYDAKVNKNQDRIEIESLKEETNPQRTIRDIASKYLSRTKQFKETNTLSNTYIKSAKGSNAYKRYANYLQTKSLYENFGITITTSNEDGQNYLKISESLKKAFEEGANINRGTKLGTVYGLHEIIKDSEPLFKESISFRNSLIEKMLQFSMSLEISYKEFLKYVGDANFIRRYKETLNLGIVPGSNQTEDEKAEIRRNNKKEIDLRFTPLLRGEAPLEPIISSETGNYNNFYQVDLSERYEADGKIISKKNNTSIGKEYYPLTLEASYNRLQANTYFVRSFETEVPAIPIFSPFDNAKITKTDNSKNFTIAKYIDGNPEETISFVFDDEDAVEILAEVDEEINSGDVLGFIVVDKGFEVRTDLNLLQIYRKAEALAEENVPVDGPAKVIYGELTEDDVQNLRELDSTLQENGYTINTTRSSNHDVFERVVSHNYGIVNSREAIDLIVKGKKSSSLREERPTVVTNISANIRHIMASIPIVGLEYPTHQFLGSIEPNYQISFIGKAAPGVDGGMPEALQELEKVRNLMMFNAKNFAFIPDSGNIYVDSFITKLFGSQVLLENLFDEEEREKNFFPNIVISSTDTFTVEGSPGVSGMHVRFSESKSYTEERVAPARTTQINEEVLSQALENYKVSNNSMEIDAGGLNLHDFYSSTAIGAEAEYIGLRNWKTKNFTSQQWYKYSTRAGSKAARKLDPSVANDVKLDKNAFLFVKEYLEPLQKILSSYDGKKYRIHFKYGGTFDSPVGTHRTTKSNHFANVAADIYVPGMNAMELAAIINACLEAGVIGGKSLRGDNYIDKSIRNAGLGIYGKEAHNYAIEMNRSTKANGFIHIDANFTINLIKENDVVKSFNYSPNSIRRVWVGEKDEDAFRSPKHDDYTFDNQIDPEGSVYFYEKSDEAKKQYTRSLIQRSSSLFWGGRGGVSFQDSYLKIIYNDHVIGKLSNLNLQDQTDEDTEHEEEETVLDSNERNNLLVSGRGTSLREDESIYTRKGLAESLGVDISAVKTLSFEEVVEQKELQRIQEEPSKDFEYIHIATSGLFNNRSGADLQRVRDAIRDTSYIVYNDTQRVNVYAGGKETPAEKYGAILKVPKYKKRNSLNALEQKHLNKMLDAFQLLASTVLTETYLYADDWEEELKRINKRLGLDVVPSLYNTVEACLLGKSHLYSNLSKEVEGIIKSENLNNTEENGNLLGLGVGTSLLLKSGFAIKSAGSLAAAGAVPIVGLVVGSGLAIYGVVEVFSESSAEENWSRQSKRVNFFLNKFEVTRETEAYKSNLENLYNHYIAKGEFKSDFSPGDYDTVLTKLGISTTVQSGIDNYIKIIFTKHPAFKYFEEIGDDLSTSSTLRSLINYQAGELTESEDVRKFIGSSLILGGGALRKYLSFLLEFPSGDKLGFDTETAAGIFNFIGDKVNLKQKDLSLLYYPSGGLNFTEKQPSNLINLQTKDIEYGFDNFFTKEVKESLKQNQEDKIKWLKGILNSILETKVFIDKSEEISTIRERLESNLNIFDSNTYEDIVVPTNPELSAESRKLDPSFYYWTSKEINKERRETLNERDKKQRRNILQNSLNFEKAISSGLYTGPKRKIINGSINLKKEEGLSNNDVELYALNKYTFKDKIDQGVESEISSEVAKQNIGRNMSVGGANIDAVREEYKALMESFKGKFPITTNTISDEYQKNDLALENIDEMLKLSEDSFDEFYSDDDMIKAFPTFKLYLIEEDEEISDRLIAFDDFYYYNSVIGFSYTNSRELPAQTATIQLQNISGTLDGTKKGELRDIDVEKDRRVTTYAGDDNIVVDGIVLRPGINVQLRAGYGAHSRDLSVLLNGRVTEVNYSSDNMTVNVTVQSFGYELDSNFKNTYAEGVKNTFNTTGEVLSSLVYSEELKHFGKIKKGKIFPFEQSGVQKVLDIEKLDEDVSYGYALFNGSLDFFERNGPYIIAGLIAIELLGPIAKIARFSFPVFNKALTKTYEIVKKVGLFQKPTIRVGASFGETVAYGAKMFAYSPLAVTKGSYKLLNALVGKNYYDRFFTDKKDALKFYKLVRRGKPEAEIINALNLSTYQANRLLGKSIPVSVINKFRGKMPSGILDDLTRKDIALRVLQQKYGTQYALRYARNAGLAPGFNFRTYMTVLQSQGSITTTSAFFNQFNIIPKVGAIIAGGAVTSIVMGLSGMILADSFATVFGGSEEYEFQRRKNRLKKRIILSPTDDNLFPPAKDSYIRENNKGFFESLWDRLKRFGTKVSKNLFIGFNLAASYGLASDKKAPSIETIIKSKIELSSKYMREGIDNLFVINNQSVWDVLKELTYRHPGYVYGIRPYGEKFEYRIFFGKPNQRYYADSITNTEAIRLNKIYEALSSLKNDNIRKELSQVLYPEISYTNDTASDLTKLAYKEFVSKTKRRFRPFRRYHSVKSHKNLIANNIITSGHDVINTVQVHTVISEDASVGENNKDDVYTVTLKASENIPRELEKTKTLQMENIRGIGNANRYGIAELIYQTKEMYTGSVLILGDDKINPWDVIIFNDQVTNMYGPLEVKAVTHMFSHETGFLTDLEVNAVVSANDFYTLPMLQQTFVYETRKHILEEYRNRRDFGLTGKPVDDKALLRSSVVKAINNMSDTEKGILEATLTGLSYAENTGTAFISWAAGSLYSSATSNEKYEKILDAVVDKLYESYKNPSAVNFLEDVSNPFQDEITSEIGESGSSLEAAVGTTGIAGGVTVAAKRKYLNTVAAVTRGSFSGYGIAAGALFLADSYTFNFFGSAVNKVSKYFYDDYVEENIAKPFILAKTTDETTIRIAPLIKDGKPLLAGGYEKISEQERWQYVFGNFYNNMSDGYRGYLREKKRLHAEGTKVLNNLKDYSFIEERKIDIVKQVGGEKLVGYFYGEEK